MFEILKSLLFAALMVPLLMALILLAIYGVGALFNIISAMGSPKSDRS